MSSNLAYLGRRPQPRLSLIKMNVWKLLRVSDNMFSKFAEALGFMWLSANVCVLVVAQVNTLNVNDMKLIHVHNYITYISLFQYLYPIYNGKCVFFLIVVFCHDVKCNQWCDLFSAETTSLFTYCTLTTKYLSIDQSINLSEHPLGEVEVLLPASCCSHRTGQCLSLARHSVDNVDSQWATYWTRG